MQGNLKHALPPWKKIAGMLRSHFVISVTSNEGMPVRSSVEEIFKRALLYLCVMNVDDLIIRRMSAAICGMSTDRTRSVHLLNCFCIPAMSQGCQLSRNRMGSLARRLWMCVKWGVGIVPPHSLLDYHSPNLPIRIFFAWNCSVPESSHV